jgi:AraC-like DNA-binding protein
MKEHAADQIRRPGKLLMLQTKPCRSTPEADTVRIERCGRYFAAAPATAPVRFSRTRRHDRDIEHHRIRRARIEDLTPHLSRFCSPGLAQLEPGPVCADFEFAQSMRAAVFRYRTIRGLHLFGAIGEAWFVLGCVRQRGQSDSVDRISFGGPRQSFDWLLRPGDELFLVALAPNEEERFPREARSVARLAGHLCAGAVASVWSAHTETAHEANRMLSRLLNRAMLKEGEVECFEEAVFKAVIAELTDIRTIAGRVNINSTAALVERACQTARNMPKCFPMSDLCHALRVSSRSLLYAFNAATGVGPRAYFTRRRLSYARHLLSGATGPRPKSVTEAALAAGFTEFGRFSGNYGAFFGEKPSETLRRSRLLAGESANTQSRRIRAQAGISWVKPG